MARAKRSRSVRDLLGEVCGPGVTRTIARAFDLMGVAEEEILAAARVNPGSLREVWSTFPALCPTREMTDADDAVFRSHCREQVARAVAGESLEPGTRAEVLLAVSRATLASRLDRDVELLGLRLADEIFPGRGLADGMREELPGRVEEDLREFRRKLRVRGRAVDLREPPGHFLEKVRAA